MEGKRGGQGRIRTFIAVTCVRYLLTVVVRGPRRTARLGPRCHKDAVLQYPAMHHLGSGTELDEAPTQLLSRRVHRT